jgi:hypothetical protein
MQALSGLRYSGQIQRDKAGVFRTGAERYL